MQAAARTCFLKQHFSKFVDFALYRESRSILQNLLRILKMLERPVYTAENHLEAYNGFVKVTDYLKGELILLFQPDGLGEEILIGQKVNYLIHFPTEGGIR